MTSNAAFITWTLVVPVKELDRAKSRLAAFTGPHRARLALAIAVDTVSSALRSPRVRTVLVVTDDPVADRELAAAGAKVIPDEPRRGLNAALRHGAARARLQAPGSGVAALSADLPALRDGELTRVLDVAARHQRAFVPDATGAGTTLYAARPDASFDPAFGNGSRQRHHAAGAREIVLDGILGLRRDVDTIDDLRAVLSLGAGPLTTAAARELPALATAAGSVRNMQATVRSYDAATRSGSVLLDDGSELSFDSAAFDAGGLRLLRLGQRVNIATGDGSADQSSAGQGSADQRRVTAITLGTFPLPGSA